MESAGAGVMRGKWPGPAGPGPGARLSLRQAPRPDPCIPGRPRRGAADILVALQPRGTDAPDGIRHRITASTDPDLLRHWLTRAAVAPSAEEIFTDADA